MRLTKIKGFMEVLLRRSKHLFDIFAYALIFVLILASSIPPLLSGNKLNDNDDFFQYLGRHEAVRKAVFEYHTFPQRSFWFGGGYPTIGDPEDSTLNPLIILTFVFGSIRSLKIIPFLAILIGGLSTYALGRHVLGYTKWGSLFSGLIFGLSLFIPLRIQDGNPNEVYAGFLPLCLLLIGLACRGRKIALLILPFVLYTMLSDGKLNAMMIFLYLIIICVFDVIPKFNTFASSEKKIKTRPIKIIILALIVTFFIGMIRILPALDLIASKGGIGNIDLYFQAKTYSPEGVFAYTYQQLWQELIGWKKAQGLVTIGWLPVLLSLISFYIFRKESFPFGVILFLFCWLILAFNAPVDLLKFLWKVPIFSAIYRPYKYFSFEIAFTFAIVSGQFFWLIAKIHPRLIGHIIAIILVIAGVWFLYPKMAKIQKETYTLDLPPEYQVKSDEFFNIQGKDIVRNRREPLNSLTYTNLIRNIGTVDWHTGIPIAENATPRYFIGADGIRIPNPNYHGESYFLDSNNIAQAYFIPNSIIIQVIIEKPDTLIINQNYHRDWRTNQGNLSDRNGLLALELNDIGTYNITLQYISRSFFIGLIVSFFSLLFLVFVCWCYKTGRLERWYHTDSSFVKRFSQVILWLIK
jgi:hypothetical protein